MADQFYDANYEALQRYKKERLERAIDKLAEKYADELSAQYMAGWRSSKDPEVRRNWMSYGRNRALEELERLGREF